MTDYNKSLYTVLMTLDYNTIYKISQVSLLCLSGSTSTCDGELM